MESEMEAIEEKPLRLTHGPIHTMNTYSNHCEEIEIKVEIENVKEEDMEGFYNECQPESRIKHELESQDFTNSHETFKGIYKNNDELSFSAEDDNTLNTIMDKNNTIIIDSNENNIFETEYACHICNKTFDLPSSLKYHAKTHTGEKKYKCDVCNYAFLEKGNLQAHLRIHAGEKPYKCLTCNKYFTEMSYLKKHMKIHIGERLFHCDICKREFMRRDALVIHMKRTHFRKPYKCHRCQESFSSKDSLEKHAVLHKQYKCDICEQTFTWRYNLLKHNAVHKGTSVVQNSYKQCDICHKKFTMHSSLVKHISIHTGEKPFDCDICGKSFRRQDGLLTHRRRHTGDNHKCGSCNKSYARRCDLKRHVLQCAKVKLEIGEL